MKIVISDDISEYSAQIQDGCTIDEVVTELKVYSFASAFLQEKCGRAFKYRRVGYR